MNTQERIYAGMKNIAQAEAVAILSPALLDQMWKLAGEIVRYAEQR